MSSGHPSSALTTTFSARSHSTPTPTSLAAAVTTVAAAISNGISAYVTPCPGLSGTPNIVHVVIHTTVTISDFARYYTIPISSFHPSYLALQDGTLLSPIYTENLRVSEGWLVMGGALSVFFLRNTYKAIQYTRIVNVKNNSLFYMLIASQAIGIVVAILFVAADFSPGLNCTAVGMVKKAGALISCSLLITGILGTKAYRCLSNAGFVIVILALLRATIIALCGIVLIEFKGGRRFTGTCETVSESPLMPISVVVQCLETCFICSCFLWAVYRSYRSPAYHARLSLPMDEVDERSSIDTEDYLHGGPGRRGWWDYVPKDTSEKTTCPLASSGRNTPKDMADRFRRWWSGEPMLPSSVFQRKPSLPGELPLPQPRRVSPVANSAASVRRTITREGGPRGNSPPPPSVMERIIRYVPRADLLRNVLKNELLYSTFITAVLLVIAVVMLVGVTQQLLLGANSWIMLDWLIISICTMHSFGRVARRHERESWLHDPDNWRTTRHAEVEDATALRPNNPRRAWSPVRVSSNWRQRQRQRGESDSPSSFSRYHSSDLPEASSTSSPRIRSISSSTRTPDLPVPVSRSTSVVSSPVASLDAGFRPPAPWHGRLGSSGTPTLLPSPDYPPSASSTPHSHCDSHAILPRAYGGAVSSPTRRASSLESSPSRRVSRGRDTEHTNIQDAGQR